jgi:SAM-dependent methyltransferase
MMEASSPMFRQTAHVYDLLYGSLKDYESEAAQLHELIQAKSPGAQSLLDVACGTGAHLAHLRQWYEIVGLDIDPAMLEHARRRLADTRLVEADMRTFQLDTTFDAVTCLFSAVGYLRSTEDLHGAVATMAAHLSPGGVLIIDGWVRPEAWRGESSVHLDTAEDGSTKVVRMAVATRRGRTTVLDMHHLISIDGKVEYVVDHHELTLFESSEYSGALHDAGLDVEVIDSPMPDRDRYVGRRASSRG